MMSTALTNPPSTTVSPDAAHSATHPTRGDVRFWDRIAKRYARVTISDQAAYEKKLSITQRYFRPDSKVLEFGCGTGSTALTHAPHLGELRAIDVSQKMLDFAAAKAEQAGARNVRFELGSIEALEVDDASLDVVLGLSILHLLRDRRAAIAKVYRMLRPGAVFISSTVCLGDTQRYVGWVASLGRRVGLLPYLEVFTRGELEQCLRSAGFELEHSWQPGKGKAVFVVARKPDDV